MAEEPEEATVQPAAHPARPDTSEAQPQEGPLPTGGHCRLNTGHDRCREWVCCYHVGCEHVQEAGVSAGPSV